MFRRHQDLVRLRHDAGAEKVSAHDVPTGKESVVDAGLPVSTPEPTEEVAVPSTKAEHAHMGTQAPLVTPTPDPPKALGLGVPVGSQRTRKLPDRLSI